MGCELIHKHSNREESNPITLDAKRLKLGLNDWLPLLKHFESLTEDDANKLGWASLEDLKEVFYSDPDLDEFTCVEFHYLLSIHIDLFGLIPSGEAGKL